MNCFMFREMDFPNEMKAHNKEFLEEKWFKGL